MKKESAPKQEKALKEMDRLDALKESFIEANTNSRNERYLVSRLEDAGVTYLETHVGKDELSRIAHELVEREGMESFNPYQLFVEAIPDPKERTDMYKHVRKDLKKVDKQMMKNKDFEPKAYPDAVERSLRRYEEFDQAGLGDILLTGDQSIVAEVQKALQKSEPIELSTEDYGAALKKIFVVGIDEAESKANTDESYAREKYENALDQKHEQLLDDIVKLRKKIDDKHQEELAAIVNDLGQMPDPENLANEKMRTQVQEWLKELSERGEELSTQRDQAFEEKVQPLYDELVAVREKIAGLDFRFRLRKYKMNYRLGEKDELWSKVNPVIERELMGAVLDPRLSSKDEEGSGQQLAA